MRTADRFGRLARVAVTALLLACGGCASMPRESFTALDQLQASIPGYGAIRTWADLPASDIARLVGSPLFRPTPGHDVNFLALSGGGAGGSFAAGLLKGWSEAGTRPTFDIVSGVSTGALIAPFAFLGQSYDDLLHALYTGAGASDIASPSLVELLSGSGLLDPEPLRRIIERYATADLLDRIAAEHRRGRRLLVITTNLDAQRPVLWDLGAIAASGRPDARKLFQDILLASASIPAVYPPVMIEAAGPSSRVSEMHVDGGTSTQVFSLPDVLLAQARPVPRDLRKHIHLWVVINNALPPEFAMTRSGIIPVALRSFATLMKSQTKGIVAASYEASQRLGIDFNLAYIDRASGYDPRSPFASTYMDTVYALGETEARSNEVWRKSLAGTAFMLSR